MPPRTPSWFFKLWVAPEWGNTEQRLGVECVVRGPWRGGSDPVPEAAAASLTSISPTCRCSRAHIVSSSFCCCEDIWPLVETERGSAASARRLPGHLRPCSELFPEGHLEKLPLENLKDTQNCVLASPPA